VLVLSRRNGEMLKILTSDGPILIRVRCGKEKVGLAIDAPAQCRILRSELPEFGRASQGGEVRPTDGAVRP